MPGADGPPVHHDPGSVEASHGHDASRHVLVASRQRDESVVPLGRHGRLDGIGNQIAGLQREAHPGGSHGNTVRHADRVEAHADAVGADDSLLNVFGELEEVHVAGVSLVPDGTNSDLWLVHVLLGHAGGVQHGLGVALDGGLGQDATPSVQNGSFFFFGVIGHEKRRGRDLGRRLGRRHGERPCVRGEEGTGGCQCRSGDLHFVV
mmetsp:Transcript_20682/g.48644  ORF Transcript_20682/g.48644 Transcript_20682/m.48644 type:complete len:206 (-) Transcript_20682:396-1013(-)